jgi:hypothetical protein
MALRVVTSPVITTNDVEFSLLGPGNPVVFSWVRLADNSLLLLVLGAIPRTTLSLTIVVGANTDSATYEVPADTEPRGMKLLEAITYAFGKQLQYAMGVPACVLRADLGLFDTTMYVDSTIGFPDRGWLRVGELVLEYTSRTAQSFALRAASLVYPKISKGTSVYSEVSLITPEGAGFGTENL